MALPPLVYYQSPALYKQHYEEIYCQGQVYIADSKIRVYFSPRKFEHAFYESTKRNGHKDLFSPQRAQRINWIKATLEHPQAISYQGWDKDRARYEPKRRVMIAYEAFVVVIGLSIQREIKSLKGNFITCYLAENSINRIRRSPLWELQKCLEALGE